MFIKITAFLLLTNLTIYLKSQIIDTNYINFYPYEGGVYSYISNKNNQLSYKNTQKNYSLNYFPNTYGYFGLGAYYNWFDLSFNLFSYGKRDENIYGTTNRIDIQSHFYPRKYVIDLFFQFYNSFYSNNYPLTNNDNKAYLRPDIKMFHTGINLFTIKKYDKFSIKSAFSQSEIQKKSVGTFIYGTKLNFFGIETDSSFSSSLLDSIFPEDFRLISFNSLLLGICGGYMHNFVIKSWILHITAIAGLANQFQQKQLTNNIGKYYVHSTTGIILNVRIAASYCKDRYYLIISGINDNCQYSLSNNIKLEHLFGRVDITFGYRLFKKK